MATKGVTDTDKGWKALLRRVKADPHVMTVGVQGNAAQVQHAGTSLTNAELASVHEFGAVIQTSHGTITIPERSFIRSTIDNHNGYKSVMDKIGDALIAGKIADVPQALGVLGQKISSDIKRAIETGIPPPNAPSTIAHKGSSKPLIDTAQMKNAITYEVKKV